MLHQQPQMRGHLHKVQQYQHDTRQGGGAFIQNKLCNLEKGDPSVNRNKYSNPAVIHCKIIHPLCDAFLLSLNRGTVPTPDTQEHQAHWGCTIDNII